MNNRIMYYPLTATPFKRNSFYTELFPCKNYNPTSDAIGERKILLYKLKMMIHQN